jgi:hypothetical protein
MIVHDLNVGGFSVLPYEANPILIIDPDAVMASTITLESLLVQAGAFEIAERTG